MRRLSLSLALVPALLLTSGCFLFPQPPDNAPASIPELTVASGDADHTSVVLWAASPETGRLTMRLFAPGATDAPLVTREFEVVESLVPVKAVFDGLTPGAQYAYEAIDAAGTRAAGRFRLPNDPAAGFQGVRFGVSGDWRGELAPYPAVRNVPAAELDFFVALGDTIYADVGSPALADDARTLGEFRVKYVETLGRRFGENSIGDLRASTSLYAVIDDHELTNDFSGGAPPAGDERFAGDPAAYINQSALFRAGLRAFGEFHPLRDEVYADTRDPRFDGAVRLYRERTFGRDAALFVLDARSFRDPPVEVGVLDFDGFFAAARAPGRTMLGSVQLADLQRGLLAAEAAGVTWKFVCVPEPIQNLGALFGGDRFEGYAAERDALLRFIDENAIRNVVFVSADIHCTIINNLTYASTDGRRQTPLDSFEVVTGAVAYDAPFGPTTAQVAAFLPVFGPPLAYLYNAGDRAARDALLTSVIDGLLERWGYDTIGLDGSGLPFERRAGEWTTLHTYGWTLFEVDAASQRLRITTYGIDWYSEQALLADTQAVLSREPEVVSEIVVEPR